MFVQSYLFFDGRCDEAIAFYQQALGAEVEMLMRFKDNPDVDVQAAPEMAEKVMHASIRIGETSMNLSDGHCVGNPNFDGFSLSLGVRDAAEAERIFAAVGEGGEVVMPLTRTFYAEKFGMAKDKFGVLWMVITAPPVK